MATAPKNAPKKFSAPIPEKAPQAPSWHVIDTMASHDSCAPEYVRIHQVGGINYKVPAIEPGCPMPSQHALVFLKDRSFRVFNSEGELVEPLRPTTQSGQAIGLARHEVIATYYELRKDALLKRAAKYPAGAVFNNNTPVEKIIEFLLTINAPVNQKVQARPAIKGISEQAAPMHPAGDDDQVAGPAADLGDADEVDLDTAGIREEDLALVEADEDGGGGFLPPQPEPVDLGDNA